MKHSTIRWAFALGLGLSLVARSATAQPTAPPTPETPASAAEAPDTDHEGHEGPGAGADGMPPCPHGHCQPGPGADGMPPCPHGHCQPGPGADGMRPCPHGHCPMWMGHGEGGADHGPAGMGHPMHPMPTCAQLADASAGASIVTVESGGRLGAGALVHDARHVVTSLSVVVDGHGVGVVDRAGNRRRARTVLVAEDDDLALLELDGDLGSAAPMEIADWSQVTLGASVVVLGVPDADPPRGMPGGMRGLLPWGASQGIVSARGIRAIQTDAATHVRAGTPVVGCHGRLVALVGASAQTGGTHAEGVRAMPAAPAIADLVARIGHGEGYAGRVDLVGGLALAALYEDPTWLGGATLTLGIVALDAVTLAARGGYFFSNEQPTGSDVVSLHRERFRADGFIAWRQLIAVGRMAAHLELGAGGSVTSANEQQRRAVLTTEAGASTLRFTDTGTQSWSVRPMLVLNLQAGPMLAGYTVEFDVDREHAVHVFQLGGRY